MELKCPEFENGQQIPREFTCDGKDVSPPLEWSDPPPGVQEFAILVEDEDAPRDHRFYHWVMWGIPPQITMMPRAIPRDGREELLVARQGFNSFSYDNMGYRGPAPLPGSGPHRYVFRLYALDTQLRPGFNVTGDVLDRAMNGHVLAEAELVGVYER